MRVVALFQVDKDILLNMEDVIEEGDGFATSVESMNN